MTIKDLILDLEHKISEVKKSIEIDEYNGLFHSPRYARLSAYNYCLDKLKEISTYACEKFYGDGVAEAIEKFAL